MSIAAGDERRAHRMRVSERRTTTPVGLSRFLVTHREHDGFETLRDHSLVTVVCSGCEASFSYLKPAEEETPADIDAALAQITSGRNGRNGGNGRAAAPTAPERRAEPDVPESPPRRDVPASSGVNRTETPVAVSPAERLNEPHPFRRLGRRPRAVTARRLAPPGPHAPRRRRNAPFEERVLVPLRDYLDRAVAWLVPRRRTIALTVLALAGAYVVIALSQGDDANSSSEPSTAPADAGGETVAPTAQSTSPPAAPDEGPMAEGARPLQSFEAGGPNVTDQTVADSFAVAMPPDWTREVNPDGSTLLTADDGGGSVTVIAQPRGTVTYSQMTDEAAAHISTLVEPGTTISRPTWKWVGNLLSVALASEPDGHNEIAYIGVTPDTRYLVIRSIEPAASALVRLQADGIVTSLTAQ